jgi:hypothetical protein
MEDIEHIYEIPEKGVIETHLNRRGLALRVLRVNHGRQAWFSIKKWIPFFEGIANVMFTVSLADYDEPGIYGVGQVCAFSYVLIPTICVTIRVRRDWLNTSPFSNQSSALPGSNKRRSYYT